jgi:hypothetical protein
MWYAQRAAFRAGYVSGTQWDKDSIGNYSFAAGLNTKAKGLYSNAFGVLSEATGFASNAFGYGALATNDGSFAMGSSTIASGKRSTAMGYGTQAAGENSTATGVISWAMGNASTAIGSAARANGELCIAIGESVTANAWISTSLGRHNDPLVQVPGTTWVLTEPLLMVGNGTGTLDKKNALVITKNGNNYIDPSGLNSGNVIGNSLLFGLVNSSGEGISSKRSATGNQYGLDFFTAGISRMSISNSGNIGIGTSTPVARLHVMDTDVLFSGTGDIPLTPGSPALQGAGRRMMWYADKAAFRTGFVNGVEWDKDSIGNYSFASGYNTRAKGAYSTAFGSQTTASGYFSTAMGLGSIAAGYAATAEGFNSKALGDYSSAIGPASTASGNYSTALGLSSVAIGNASTAIGGAPRANAEYSMAIGESVTANSWISTSLGRHNDPIIGSPTTTWVLTEPILIVGNGTGVNDKKNALVILKNGNTGIGTNTPAAPLSFANTTGPKISLYNGTENAHYGFGVQAYQLQLFADNVLARISFGYYTGGVFTERMYFDNNSGTLNVAGVNYASDERFKKQITTLKNPLGKIEAINVVEYYMRTDEFPGKHFNDNLQVGLIAQEVEKILPQAVQTGSDGYKAIDYARVVPLLVEGIKEQQKQLAGFVEKSIEQQKQIDVLASHEKEYQQQLDELKNLVKKLTRHN